MILFRQEVGKICKEMFISLENDIHYKQHFQKGFHDLETSISFPTIAILATEFHQC